MMKWFKLYRKAKEKHRLLKIIRKSMDPIIPKKASVASYE